MRWRWLLVIAAVTLVGIAAWLLTRSPAGDDRGGEIALSSTTPPSESATPPPAPATDQPTIRQPSAPTTTPSPQPSPTPALPADDQAAAEQAVREGTPRDPLALATSWGLITQTVALAQRPPAAIGDSETFWATNVANNQHFQVTATLRVQSPHLRLYVADDIQVEDGDLQQAADTFERQSWPLLTAWYDEAALPTEPITVLNARIPGVGGYYAADNELPRALNHYSNEREIIFINAASFVISSPSYVGVLTHETQHLLHRNVLTHPATWFNEGASMLSEDRTGFGGDALVRGFLNDPDLQLNAWASTPGTALAHYGAAELFLRYLDAQTPGGLPIGELARADAGDAVDALVDTIGRSYPDLTTLGDVYATWATANLLDDKTLEGGRYGYVGLPATVEPQAAPAADQATVHQLGADYLAWQPADNARRLEWQGAASVPLIAAPVDEGETIWWSGRGDSRVSALTTAIDVPESGATLHYRAWLDIEQDYDYAYLTVSTDGGRSWRGMPTPLSSDTNPLGLNLGGGWTGRQAEWQEQAINLEPWRGKSIQLRFWTITDEAYNAPGLALADLRVDGAPAAAWTGAGFVTINNRLPQGWELRGVLFPPAGAPQVVEVPVVNGRAEWDIPPQQRAVLIVTATSAATTEEASYSYRLGE